MKKNVNLPNEHKTGGRCKFGAREHWGTGKESNLITARFTGELAEFVLAARSKFMDVMGCKVDVNFKPYVKLRNRIFIE